MFGQYRLLAGNHSSCLPLWDRQPQNLFLGSLGISVGSSQIWGITTGIPKEPHEYFQYRSKIDRMITDYSDKIRLFKGLVDGLLFRSFSWPPNPSDSSLDAGVFYQYIHFLCL
jgi:hypothetical protein